MLRQNILRKIAWVLIAVALLTGAVGFDAVGGQFIQDSFQLSDGMCDDLSAGCGIR